MLRNLLVATGLVVALAASASAQVWAEVGDAPQGVPANQATVGVGPLTAITGVIDRPAGDHTDTYCITVTDVSLFYATTKIFYGGSAVDTAGANADTRLWIWDLAGNELLGNDDINAAALGTSDNFASLVSDPSTFPGFSGGELVNGTATGISLTNGSRYLLSISEFANDPDDAGGVDLINLGADFDALHGPNPSAGSFAAWENAADSTKFTYKIALAGATFCEVPEPASLSLLALGGLLALRRRS